MASKGSLDDVVAPDSLMQKQKVILKLTGVRPLLCHNPASMKPSGGLSTNKYPSPEEEAKGGVYKNEKGEYSFPIAGIRNCLIFGAGKLRLKFGKMTASSAISGGLFPFDGNVELVPILDPKTMKPVTKYDVDARSVIVNKGRVVRGRPKFFPWAILAAFEVNTNLVPVDGLLKITNAAGEIVGIGDFRVANKGMFGQFTATVEK